MQNLYYLNFFKLLSAAPLLEGDITAGSPTCLTWQRFYPRCPPSCSPPSIQTCNSHYTSLCTPNWNLCLWLDSN